MFYGLATNHDYWVDKINLFVALAPVVNLSNTDSIFIKFISNLDSILAFFARKMGKDEFFPQGAKVLEDGGLCRYIPFCRMIFGFLDSIWNPYDDPRMLSASMGHFPMGSSAQQIRHFGQLVKNSEFRYFNYGKSKNKEMYGQAEPPIIDIKEITEVPVAMFVGRQDSLANVIDNRWVKD